MTVQEFIRKHKIEEARVRIYDSERGDEIWRRGEMREYYGCEVINAYPHNGDTVLQVASRRE